MKPDRELTREVHGPLVNVALDNPTVAVVLAAGDPNPAAALSHPCLYGPTVSGGHVAGVGGRVIVGIISL